jgi:hypothetical protein
LINNVALNGVAIWNYFFDNVTILPELLRCYRCNRRIRIGYGYGNTKPSSPDGLPRFYMCKRCHQDWHKTLQAKHEKFYNLWDRELWNEWFGNNSREVVAFT